MDGEHAFSAALVLVMVNIAFASSPRDSAAMDTAMFVLQGMAEKGNGHIRSKYELLKNLQSMIHRDHNTPSPGTQDDTDTTNDGDPSTLLPEMQTPAATPVDASNISGSDSVAKDDGNNVMEISNEDFENLDDAVGLIPFEAYENLDYMSMDIDWTLWTTEAARSSEGQCFDL